MSHCIFRGMYEKVYQRHKTYKISNFLVDEELERQFSTLCSTGGSLYILIPT